MILYTPVPAEMVYSDESRELKEFSYGGATIITEVDAQGTCRVVRVISSDPDDYLIPTFQPGRAITYRPVL